MSDQLNLSLFNKNLVLLIIGNILFGMIMPLLIVIGGIAGYQLAPNAALATLPASLQPVAGIIFAFIVSLFMAKYGRRQGFVVGGVFAMIGGIIAAISLYFGHFILLCVGHFILGIAIIFFGFIRFAAAESVAESQRANAIAFVQGSTVVSALIGPNIFPATKYFLPTHTLLYSYLAISVIAILGSVICRALSAEIGKTTPDPSDETTGKSARKLPNFAINFPLFTYVPILACALSFGLMVFMMAPTPLSMKHHGHSDLHTSNVIVWHVVAMFAPSFITGKLIARFGAMTITSSGFVILLLAFLTSKTGNGLWPYYSALILLGLGWNFSFIGASTILDYIAKGRQRGAILGVNETCIMLIAALSSFFGGVILAFYGWQVISTLGIVLVTAIILFLYLYGRFGQHNLK